MAAAEAARRDLAIFWTGEPLKQWSAKCPIHATTKPDLGAGGATTFHFDGGEVFGWNMTVQGSRERIIEAVIPHEVMHTVTASVVRRPVPRWLDEGIAEYFEVSNKDHKRINVEHAQRLSTAVQNGWRPDLRRLESLEDVAEMHRLDYQESWAWVHFLLHDSPDSRLLLLDYLTELRDTDQPGSLAQRIEAEMPYASDRLLGYVGGFFLPHATAAAF